MSRLARRAPAARKPEKLVTAAALQADRAQLQQIIAELLGSLDLQSWPGAADLASLYAYLLRELIAEVGEPKPGRLAGITKIVFDLRTTWQQAEAQPAAGSSADREAARVA